MRPSKNIFNITMVHNLVYCDHLYLFATVKTLKLVKHLEPVDIEEDGVATFSCELNYVVANAEWLLNNVRLRSNAIYRIQHMGTMHSLMMQKLRPQESRITFKAGLLTETTILKVKGQIYRHRYRNI